MALALVKELFDLLDETGVEEKKISIPESPTFPPLSNDAVIKAAWGKSPHRIPIWIHRQAGRYMSEFQAIRKKHEFFECCQTPEIASEITLQPINTFDLDAAIIFSDILVIPQILGLDVKLIPKRGPVFSEPLKPTEEDFKRLKTNINIQKELSYVYKAITLTRLRLNGKVPLIGFCGGPWTLMAYSTGSGTSSFSSRGFKESKKWFYLHPELTKRLLDIYSDAICDHLIGQARAGAQMLEIFESSAGCLPPQIHRKFIIPCLRKIYKRLRANIDPNIPVIMFAREGHFLLEDLIDIGFQVIALDWAFDVPFARSIGKDRVTFQGNLDPWAMFGTDEQIETEVFAMLDRFQMRQKYKRRRLIVNLGHGMMPDMKPRSVKAFINAVRKYDRSLQ